MSKKSTSKEKNIPLKPSLAWTVADYLAANEEPPECVIQGNTEGEVMDREEAIDWIVDTLRCMRVLLEEYPERGDVEKQIFELDLAYLCALGKITEDEEDELTTAENYVFYEEK